MLCKDLIFYSWMVDYIEQQWLAFCGGWGGLLCRDLRLLLLTWLNQDADVLYARMCVTNARCDKHLRNRSQCWGQHLLQPGRRDVRMLTFHVDEQQIEQLRRYHLNFNFIH
mgnify:CR=1 FL=1